MTITVLIPTYRRPIDLCRCLDALKQQATPAQEIIVIARNNDLETSDFLRTYQRDLLPLRVVMTTTPGQVAALNAGLSNARCEIVAITDDDAAPRPDWLQRIVALFQSDPQVGAVGGRDWVHHGDWMEPDTRRVVGIVRWFGKVIGNHHLGVGPPREVELLKGANMSFRRTAIGNSRFDERLRGEGAEYSNDMAFSLSVTKSGWKVIYDPEVAVDHYEAPRFDLDQRGRFNALALRHIVHNETMILLEYLSAVRRGAYLVWTLLVGTWVAPGVLQALRLCFRKNSHAAMRWKATVLGRFDGMVTYCRNPKRN